MPESMMSKSSQLMLVLEGAAVRAAMAKGADEQSRTRSQLFEARNALGRYIDDLEIAVIPAESPDREA